MKLSLLAVVPTILAPIAAQKCGAQYQVDLCVKNADAAIANCGLSDPACVCQKQKDKAICYINCPDDEKFKGDAARQSAQIQVLCAVPGAQPTIVKATEHPTASSTDHAKPSSVAKGSESNSTPGSSTKTGNASSQFGSASIITISMGILAAFL